MGYLKELSTVIYKNNVEKGFHDEKHHLTKRLMLIVSELAECMEADRKEKTANIDNFITELPILTMSGMNEHEAFKIAFETNIKDTVEDEIADAIIRLLDLAAEKGMDPDWHVYQKMTYNKLRPHKHGGKQY